MSADVLSPLKQHGFEMKTTSTTLTDHNNNNDRIQLNKAIFEFHNKKENDNKSQKENQPNEEEDDASSVPSLSHEDITNNDDNLDETKSRSNEEDDCPMLITPTDDDDKNNDKEQEEDTVANNSIDIETSKEEEKETSLNATNDDDKKVANRAGLRNLGNTCYLNSALQMLATSKKFIKALESDQPPPLVEEGGVDDDEDDNNNSSDEHEKMKKLQLLRAEFLSLVKNLRSNNTAQTPASLKRAIDDVSSLFLGYRQQDSHEFLTTLLELLDEAYEKPKPQKVEEEKEENAVEEGEEMEVEMNCTCDKSNKQEEDTTMIEANTTTTSADPVKRVTSLAELKVDEISTLLHGTTSSSDGNNNKAQTSNKNGNDNRSDTSNKKCKLIGGRAVITGPSTAKRTTLLEGDSSLSSKIIDDDSNSATSTTNREDEEQDQEEEEPVSCIVCTNNNDNNKSKSTADEEEDNDNDNTMIITSSSSPVDKFFGTEIRSRLTCDSCKYTRSKIEKYLFLSIDIQDDTESSIEDGLRSFFAPEKLELKCEKCFCESATRTTEIIRLPSALVLHLKRFIVDISPDYSSITYRKNQSKVTFPKELSCNNNPYDLLTEFLAEDYNENNNDLNEESDEASDSNRRRARNYSLRSIVNHIGSSANCGHYTADSVSSSSSSPSSHDTDKDNNDWIRFNDSFVSKIPSEEAISDETAKTAYIVMYELDDEEQDHDDEEKSMIISEQDGNNDDDVDLEISDDGMMWI